MENMVIKQSDEVNTTEEEDLITMFRNISDNDVKESIIALIKSLNQK